MQTDKYTKVILTLIAIGLFCLGCGGESPNSLRDDWREIGICDDYIETGNLEREKEIEEFIRNLGKNTPRDIAEQLARDLEEDLEKFAAELENMEVTRALAAEVRAEARCKAWLIRN